mmetsp:Transcript_39237/g.77206  ORF Transcript_39237/g.77206 Transcript_39237/m.77206 type:complete len:182 (+) Transcript_39237:2-547(+)
MAQSAYSPTSWGWGGEHQRGFCFLSLLADSIEGRTNVPRQKGERGARSDERESRKGKGRKRGKKELGPLALFLCLDLSYELSTLSDPFCVSLTLTVSAVVVIFFHAMGPLPLYPPAGPFLQPPMSVCLSVCLCLYLLSSASDVRPTSMEERLSTCEREKTHSTAREWDSAEGNSKKEGERE